MDEDERSVSESIASIIRGGERAGILPDEITISDKAAKQLAREVFSLQYKPVGSSNEIYLDIKHGRGTFMGIRLAVAN